MRPTGRPAFCLLPLLAVLWTAAATAQAPWTLRPAYLSPCETTVIDAGRPEARWALGTGVYEDERDRRGRYQVWTSRDWRVRLLLASAGDRTLRLIGRPGPQRLELRASWNGVDLGEQAVVKGRTRIVWQVPADATRTGLNELRFTSSAAKERGRQLSFLLDRIELGPAGPGCGPVERATANAAFTLAPGAILLAEVPLPPDAEVELELVGEPGGAIELHVGRDGRPQRRIDLNLESERQTERLDAGLLMSNQLVFVSRGPAATRVRLVDVHRRDTAGAWRLACGIWWWEALLAAGFVALLGAAAASGRRWPEGRAGPWLDCALLLGLALVLRFLFLDAYPDVDPKRFGDSHEYLRRSGYIIRGTVSLWNDIHWHAWQTWIRPPGYYLFLAALRAPFGGGLQLLAPVQAVLLALTAVAGYLVAYPLFGRGAALVAGLLVAVYPQTIISASWILSDPLSLFLTTTALAGLSWVAVRPGWRLAAATGAVFGVGCLVRSAPLYFVPLAGLLLYLGLPRPRRKAPALALVVAALLVVAPWCVRNSIRYGKVMGIDDLVIPNFLMAHPDPEILPAELERAGVYGEASEAREEYFGYLWRANKGARLTRDSGRILGRGLWRMVTTPGTTLERFGLHLKIYFQGFPRSYVTHFLQERSGCRVVAWTDALNFVYLLTLVLAIAGAALAIRRRQSWPLLAWILFFVVVTNLFFYPSYMPGRYRLPIYPALAAFAGLAVSRVVTALATWRQRRRRPAGGA